MVAIKVFILSIFIFSSSVVMVDCVATMLINNDPVEDNPLLQTLGYMIYDLAAMMIWLFRILIEAVFWVFTLGAKGDFYACILAVAQCASSFVYHAIHFNLLILLMPVGILDALTVMFFDEVGLGTSKKEDGTKYVAFKDVPVFGEVTDGIYYLINGLHYNVLTKLGNPTGHTGGIYDIIEHDLCVPRACVFDIWGVEVCTPKVCISIGMILDATGTWDAIDVPISFFYDKTEELLFAWLDFQKAEIFPFDFLDEFLHNAVNFTMKNAFSWLILEDTYYLYWKGLGMTTPNTWLDQDYATPIMIDAPTGDGHYEP